MNPFQPKSESKTAGLYVHVPFCLGKCPYCHFYSTAAITRIPEWVEAVLREGVFYRERFERFDTLYLGGGTPSLLSESALADLLEGLGRIFSIAPGGEMTLEVNPNDLTPEKLRRWKSWGLNRISLGAQSLDDGELRFLKRRHTAEEVGKAGDWIRSAGFDNLSLDLIYGLPGQSLGAWAETLEKISALKPEHLSCYELTVEAGTPLERQVRAGEIRLSAEKDLRAFFLHTSSFLEDRGYEHYEVSNFALGAARTARHNQKYWDHRRVLGLGPSAHSFDGVRRWWNGRSLKRYLERLALGRSPAEGEETLSSEQRRLETLLLGFRTRSGVALKDLSLNPERRRALKALERAGKVIQKQDRLLPTPEGFLVADSLPLLFC